MSNKTLGNTFENELCEILAQNGFWVHPMVQNNAGQPADVIAVRNRVAYLIDAKVCSNDTFPLNRVEENQELAMHLWDYCGNGMGWFALKTSKGIFMLSYFVIKAYKNRQSSLSLREIIGIGTPVDKWVKKCK